MATKKSSSKAKSKKNSAKTKDSKLKSRMKLGLKLIIAGTLLVCLFVLIKYGIMLIKYKEYAAELVADDSSFKSSLTTLVYDTNGNVIASLSAEKDSYYLESDEIPYVVKRAFVTTEDRQFYEHGGVDYKAILRAFIALIQNEGEVTQGGSTITQQLARNIFLSHEVSIERKIKEMFIAGELENTYTKDQILEFYINNIYFGNGYYGIEAASRGYFNKTITDLTTSQMLFLCAIPNNPSKYDPLENMSATVKRRDLIAKQLYEQDEIDKELYTEITEETIGLYISSEEKHDYVETFVRYCATRELMRMRGFVFTYKFDSDAAKEAYDEYYAEEYNYCNSLLFTGGYRIYTSIDMSKQDELQATVNNICAQYSETNEEGIYAFQSSSTVIDNLTGFVVAIVGGREQEHSGYSLNRAFQSFRQPGSSIKPLVVYTPAFERNYTPDTIVLDEKFQGGPSNAGNVYAGEISLRTAVETSKNTVAWKIFEKIGPYTALPYLLEMDFRKIVKSDYVSAASLGGLTYGVSTFEMATAYAALENGGVYRNGTCIVKITDDSGNVLVDNSNNSLPSRRVYEENAANTMTNVLKGVLTNGTGRKYPVSGITCAAKTGTTNNNYDSWFVGYSYYYTTAVWCGYDMPREMSDKAETTCAGLIWQSYMTYLHEDLQNIEIGTFVDTPGLDTDIPEEQRTEEPTSEDESSTEYETDEFGNIIEPVTDPVTGLEPPTDEFGNPIEESTTIAGDPGNEDTSADEISSDEGYNEDTETTTTEPATDELGHVIEPITNPYVPDDIITEPVA